MTFSKRRAHLLMAFAAALCILARPAALAQRAEPQETAAAPGTSILDGAEEHDLGPEDADAAVLFVHGFIGGGKNFNDLPERLAEKGYRVRVMRLPGHGTRPEDLEGVTADQLLDAVLAELRALRQAHDRLGLIGHSMGGSLCILAASREKVDALALGAPYFAVTRHWYYVLKPETWTRLLRPVVRRLPKGRRFVQINREEARDNIVSYAWTPTEALLTLYELGERAAAPDVLESVTCPVLLIHARGDVAASPGAAGKAFEAMAAEDKRMVWLEKSNHHIFWDYEQKRVAEEVLRFLERVMPSAGGGERLQRIN